MYCQYCGNKLATNSKYCGKCGKNTSKSVLTEILQSNSIKTININQSTYEICGKLANVKYIEFYENRGVLIMRYHREIKGKLCKDCINKYFWKFTLTTLFIGWFGAISFFVTPIYIINNVFRYLGTKIK